MTQHDLAAALTNRLRREGLDFPVKNVEAFAADAWAQGAHSPDLDAWVECFLAAQAQGRFAGQLVRKRQGTALTWTGLVCSMLAISGCLLEYLRPRLGFNNQIQIGVLVLIPLLPVGVFLSALGLSFRFWPVYPQGGGLIRTGRPISVLGILGCLLWLYCGLYCGNSFIMFNYGPTPLLIAIWAAVFLLPFGVFLIALGLSFRYWPVRRPGGGLIRAGLSIVAPGIPLFPLMVFCHEPLYVGLANYLGENGKAYGYYTASILAEIYAAASLWPVGLILIAVGLLVRYGRRRTIQ
jgi:hypothetical protein